MSQIGYRPKTGYADSYCAEGATASTSLVHTHNEPCSVNETQLKHELAHNERDKQAHEPELQRCDAMGKIAWQSCLPELETAISIVRRFADDKMLPPVPQEKLLAVMEKERPIEVQAPPEHFSRAKKVLGPVKITGPIRTSKESLINFDANLVPVASDGFPHAPRGKFRSPVGLKVSGNPTPVFRMPETVLKGPLKTDPDQVRALFGPESSDRKSGHREIGEGSVMLDTTKGEGKSRRLSTDSSALGAASTLRRYGSRKFLGRFRDN